jgi:hypothetical protein
MESSKEVKASANVATVSDQSDNGSEDHGKKPVPLSMKILSVVIVSMIGFGGHWSSGVTGALKSTLKKVIDLVAAGEQSLTFMVGTPYHKHPICNP